MYKIIIILIFILLLPYYYLFSQEFFYRENTNTYYLNINTRNELFDGSGYSSYGGITKTSIYSLMTFPLFRSFRIFINISDTSLIKITIYNQFRDSIYELFNKVLPPNYYDFFYMLEKNNLIINKNGLYRIFIEARNNVTDSIFEQAINNYIDLDTLCYGSNKNSIMKYIIENKSIIFTNKIYVRLDTLKE